MHKNSKHLLIRLLRTIVRLLWLAGELTWFAAGYLFMVTFRRGGATRVTRAHWLQWASRRGLRIFNVKLHSTGDLPIRGLIVCNHLGYLDILVLASLVPTMFVAKKEVAAWPVFGWFARKSGAVFVDREKRAGAVQSAREIEAALKAGALVALFPEGTSSGGENVLPFKSSLLAPATQSHCAVTASCIQYAIPEGDAATDVCYWGDMTLVPHIVNLLGISEVSAHLAFKKMTAVAADRKQLARQLHAEVLALKNRYCCVDSTVCLDSPGTLPMKGTVSPTLRPV